MDEEKKTGLADAVETGASAAHTIKGAIKAGKAISGAAKGAAAGGPYGAVAGAVWAGRKHIGKIITVIIILLLLPVLFILMLPGLIFGGLVNAFSPADSEAPVLNSETAIVENANDITFTINSILGEALDDVMARIEKDFASSGADHMEIKNSYSSGPVFNANLIISQYCAARDEDFESISLDDLAAVLRDNKEHLYSYTSVQESREVTTEDPETGEETTTTETWIIYTIRYNGESYLADHVFALTDEQKELASDYASNLSTFLGDGLLQNMTEWTGNSIPSLGDVTFTDGVTPVVYYNQLDERYASQHYGTDNIGGYGCGPTSMAIVVSSLTDDTVDPVEMAQWSYENGYWCDNSGSYHALIPAAAEAWGLPVSGCTTSEPQRIVDALSEGKLVVAIMAEGHFTSSGHFIVLRGVKDGQIMVLDNWPERFAPYLTGDTDTNRLKSEIGRRLRLHRLAETYVTMDNAGVGLFQDEKPKVFAPQGYSDGAVEYPSFYSSREVKEMGVDTTQIRSSRFTGVLLTSSGIYVTYNSSAALMKWRYKSEMRVKALMWSVLCQQRLTGQYNADAVQGVVLGESMELAYQMLTSTGGAKHDYFMLDGSYDHFFFFTNDHQGEVLLALLCDCAKTAQLNDILKQGLTTGAASRAVEHDAFEADGTPVLFCYFFDLPRIARFNSALDLMDSSGTIICFDFQADVLRRYCGSRVRFQTIDFIKFERRFFP